LCILFTGCDGADRPLVSSSALSDKRFVLIPNRALGTPEHIKSRYGLVHPCGLTKFGGISTTSYEPTTQYA